MKALLLLLIVLGGVWLWRNRQTPGKKGPSQKTAAALVPQDMVRCSRCGMHIPSNEAVTGKQGLYCSADHQRLSES